MICDGYVIVDTKRGRFYYYSDDNLKIKTGYTDHLFKAKWFKNYSEALNIATNIAAGNKTSRVKRKIAILKICLSDTFYHDTKG